jgi:hypothetical protein
MRKNCFRYMLVLEFIHQDFKSHCGGGGFGAGPESHHLHGAEPKPKRIKMYNLKKIALYLLYSIPYKQKTSDWSRSRCLNWSRIIFSSRSRIKTMRLHNTKNSPYVDITRSTILVSIWKKLVFCILPYAEYLQDFFLQKHIEEITFEISKRGKDSI